MHGIIAGQNRANLVFVESSGPNIGHALYDLDNDLIGFVNLQQRYSNNPIFLFLLIRPDGRVIYKHSHDLSDIVKERRYYCLNPSFEKMDFNDSKLVVPDFWGYRFLVFDRRNEKWSTVNVSHGNYSPCYELKYARVDRGYRTNDNWLCIYDFDECKLYELRFSTAGIIKGLDFASYRDGKFYFFTGIYGHYMSLVAYLCFFVFDTKTKRINVYSFKDVSCRSVVGCLNTKNGFLFINTDHLSNGPILNFFDIKTLTLRRRYYGKSRFSLAVLLAIFSGNFSKINLRRTNNLKSLLLINYDGFTRSRFSSRLFVSEDPLCLSCCGSKAFLRDSLIVTNIDWPGVKKGEIYTFSPSEVEVFDFDMRVSDLEV